MSHAGLTRCWIVRTGVLLMKQLRVYIAGLILGLILFFNIERLDLGQVNLVNFQTFVYLLGGGAVLSTVLFPVFARISLVYILAFWIGAYFLLKLLIFNSRPVLGDFYTYLTISELFFVTVLVSLAYFVSRGLQEFLNTVRFVTLAAGSSKAERFEDAMDMVEAELNRSRRYHRPFSVILASIEPKEMQTALPRLLVEAQEKVLQSYATARLAETMSAELRRMDVVLEDPKNGRVIVLSPEIDDQGSGILMERLSGSIARKLGIKVKCGAASFPHNALTFEDLLRQAENGTARNGNLQASENIGTADYQAGA